MGRVVGYATLGCLMILGSTGWMLFQERARLPGEFPRDVSPQVTCRQASAEAEGAVSDSPEAAPQAVEVTARAEEIRLSGTVVEEATGEPLAGVRIRCGDLRPTSTDGGGNFSLEGATAGRLTVTATREGFAARSATVETQPGVIASVVIELPPGGAIEGTVRLPDGEPAREAQVKVDGGYELIDAMTDGAGHYRLQGVLLTRRNFSVSATLGDSLRSHVEACGFGMEETVLGLDLELAENEPEAPVERSPALEPGHFLSGVVVDEADQAVEGAQVTFQGEEGEKDPSAITDPAGRFRLEDLPRSEGQITVSKAGYCRLGLQLGGQDDEALRIDKEVRLVLLEERQIRGTVVDKETGEPITTFSLEGHGASTIRGQFTSPEGKFSVRKGLFPDLERSFIVFAKDHCEHQFIAKPWPLSDQEQSLRIELEPGKAFFGQVVDAATGKPLRGVQVTYPFERNLYMVHSQWEYSGAERTTFTDADGDFRISGVPGNLQRLLLDTAGYARTALKDVKVGRGRQLFKLPREATVEGRVRPPFKDTKAWVGGGFPGSEVDAEGNYRIRGLPPGLATIEVTSPGTMTIHREVTLREGEVTVLDFLEATGSISCRVTLQGKPVENATLQLTSAANPEDSEQFITEGDGTFHLRGLPPGSYQIAAGRRAELLNTGRTFYVGEGQVDLEIALPIARLAGLAVEATSGELLEDCQVTLYRRFSPVSQVEVGSASGSTFDFDSLPPGIYCLEASLGEGNLSGFLGPIQVTKTTDREGIILRLLPAGSIALTVSRTGPEQPFENGWVHLLQDRDQPVDSYLNLDPSGQDHFVGIPTGEYQIEAGVIAQADETLPGTLSQRVTVKVLEGEETEVHLFLPAD
jgi:hypothetical protein